jgi:hypothetical protein
MLVQQIREMMATQSLIFVPASIPKDRSLPLFVAASIPCLHQQEVCNLPKLQEMHNGELEIQISRNKCKIFMPCCGAERIKEIGEASNLFQKNLFACLHTQAWRISGIGYRPILVELFQEDVSHIRDILH